MSDVVRSILSFEMCFDRYAAYYATEDGKTESYEVDAIALVENHDEEDTWRTLEPCIIEGGDLVICRDDSLYLGMTSLSVDECGDKSSSATEEMKETAKFLAKLKAKK